MAPPSSLPEFRLLEGGRAQARAALPEDAPYLSRSYSPPYALVAWHHTPVGVDIEQVQALSGAFVTSVATTDERQAMHGASARTATSFWSSKEALAKALGDALSYDPRRLGSPMFWADGVCGPWRAQELRPVPGFVAWLCWKA